jgi:hypothetical protein
MTADRVQFNLNDDVGVAGAVLRFKDVPILGS